MTSLNIETKQEKDNTKQREEEKMGALVIECEIGRWGSMDVCATLKEV